MSWRIVYIENSYRVSLYLNNIRIDDGREQYTVPISDINTIIFNNYKMHITTQLLCKLSQANVCVIFCEKNGLPEMIITPLSGSYVTFRNQELQLGLSDDKKRNLWQKIIQAKIRNQYRILIQNKRSTEVIQKLLDFMKEVQPGDSTNREGLAAKMYFRELFGPNFIREKDSADPVNTALNYGYSLLRAMLARTVAAKGFIASIGVFHKNPYNHFNLVDDFVEVYRPIVDNWVIQNMENCHFTREKRLELVSLMGEKIMVRQKKYQIMNSVFVKMVVANCVNKF